MGYRHYLYAIPKSQVVEIQACKTANDLTEFAKRHGYPYDKDDGRLSLYKVGKELYELGKHSEIGFKLESERPSLFTSDKLKERYSDYGFALLTKDDFKSVIEFYRQKIADWFKSLLEIKDSSRFTAEFTKEQYQFEMLKMEVQDKIDSWSGKYFGISPIDLNDDKERITGDWSYEYAIFELVRVYKSFDWENNELVLVGW